MAISNEEYIEFMQKIAERDAADVNRAIEVVEQAITDFQATRDAVTALRDSLPATTSFGQTSARSSIENLHSQIISFNQQFGYTRDSLKSIAQQYNPPATTTNDAVTATVTPEVTAS